MVDYILYFFIYSAAGFLIESAYTRIADGKMSVRRSMLKSPLCIVYGAGGVILAAFGAPLAVAGATEFAAGFILCSAAEYGMSLLYEKICGVLLWDYSHCRANLNGRVCALYSLYWGIISVLFFRYVHPAIRFLVENTGIWLKIMLAAVFSAYFIKDLKITVREMKKLSNGESSLCDGVLEYIVPAPLRKIF